MTNHRSLRPYPPAGLAAEAVGTDVQITWKNRNRTLPVIIKQTDPTQELEVGQTTTVLVYKSDGTTLLHTESGLTGTSYVYPNATETAEAGSLQDSLVIKVKAVRDGYDSAIGSVDFLRAGSYVVVGALTVTVGTDTVISA